MDAFFPAVEERENPQFKGMPIIVGADPKKGRGRGVVSSASYTARKFGIKSAMPISIAYGLCPEAIFLPVNMELYEKVSENIMEIIKKYSKIWEIVSLDEAYLDLSHLKNYEYAEDLAKELKKEIFEKEKLTSTVGIGPNKLIAKMASKKAKPRSELCSTTGGKPNGLLIIKPNQVKLFLEPLDIEDLPGIGEKTAEKLRVIGINKIKELKKLSDIKLQEMFGKVGERIFEKARGIDEEPVTSEEIIKSIGRQITFEKDTRNPEIIFGAFEKIVEDIWKELLANKFSFRTITVICRYQGFETHTKSKTLYTSFPKTRVGLGPYGHRALKNPIQDFEILKKEAKKLLLRFLLENKKPIRLIGLRVKIY